MHHQHLDILVAQRLCLQVDLEQHRGVVFALRERAMRWLRIGQAGLVLEV